jgi:hypothetical protein
LRRAPRILLFVQPNISDWRTVMSLLGDALGAVKSVAEDGYKFATDSHYREQAWNSAVNDAKAAANFVTAPIRAVDSAKEQVGTWIDSGEKYLEKKVDDGSAWLRENGGVLGQAASDQIGLGEGAAISLYEGGKGIVQLADGAGSLANPLEWAANPGANVARLKSAANTVETMGKLASLADPTSWITNPEGNKQTVGALWNRAATSFKKDPAKFTGNLAGTIALLAIPGAGEAGAATDAARVTTLATDLGKATTITGDVGKATAITGDVGKATAITGDVGEATAITSDAGKASAATGDVGEAGAVTGDAGKATTVTGKAGTAGAAAKPVQLTLRGVDHTIPDWHMQEINYTKRTNAAREALRADFNKTVRKDFVKDLAENHAGELRRAGISEDDIAIMANGRVPDGYQVHHLLPLDDGGTNATSNLALIKNDPDHMLITGYQKAQTKGISAGETRQLEWPMPDRPVRVWPQTPDGGARPTVH